MPDVVVKLNLFEDRCFVPAPEVIRHQEVESLLASSTSETAKALRSAVGEVSRNGRAAKSRSATFSKPSASGQPVAASGKYFTTRSDVGSSTFQKIPGRNSGISWQAIPKYSQAIGVDPVSWTPDLLGERSPRCQDQERRIHGSSASRSSSWSVSGRTAESLSREFEPTAQTIRNWVVQADRDEGRRDDGLTTAELEEIRRLRRENKRLRMERDILKKATAWFARETDSVPPRRTDS